jgi:phosphoribosylanthranilate isomerase
MQLLATRITTLTDARYFAAKEVHFLAFRFEEKADGYLDPMLFKALREWVEIGGFLGEFDQFSAQMISETVDFLKLDGVILGKNFPNSELQLLNDIRVFREIHYTDFDKIMQQFLVENQLVEAFILDADGISIEILIQICAKFPVFLKSTRSPESLVQMLEKVQPKGLIFTGGDELQVGLRSFDDIDAIFDAIFEEN